MINPHQLTGVETLWALLLLGLFGFDLQRNARSRDPLALLQPHMFLMAFMAYYLIGGPVDRLIQGDWSDRGRDFRYAVPYALAGGVLFYGSVSLGYNQLSGWKPLRRFAPPFSEQHAQLLGLRLCWAGLIAYFLANGPMVIAQLNPLTARSTVLDTSSGLDLGAFANYANNALNLLIPGVLLLFACWVRQRRKLLNLVIWTLVAVGLFTTLGFRYRVVTLLVPMAILWFLARGRRPSLALLSICGLALLLFAGIIGLTRTYGQGLDLAEIQGLSFWELFNSGFHETHVFLITGAVIENTPRVLDFVWLQPFIATLLIPIPSALLPNKAVNAEYVFNAVQYLFPIGSEKFASGAAFMGYAEYYLMAGWLSLLAMGLLLGGLLRCLWNWFSPRRKEVVAQVAYVCTCGFLYVVVSRGYLPQTVTLFAFGVAPMFVLYYLQARPLQRTQVMLIRPPSDSLAADSAHGDRAPR
jgi:hypothetical protein